MLRESVSRDERREDKRRAIEEMVEGIVEEKWSRLSTELDSIRNEFAQIQSKIEVLENSFKKTEKVKDTGFVDIEDKIDTYKQSMGEISSRMGAVEDAMKSTMSPMMQTMRSLTEAVKGLKEREPGPSSSPKSEEEKPLSREEDEEPEDSLEKKP